MAEVDYKAVQDANKGLTICFILGICFVNIALLFKIYKKNYKFMYNAKHLTLVSLAVGDIFMALFSLVVVARLTFEPESLYDVGCRTRLSASIYETFLLPFVYGVGLCVLALELLMRQRTQTSTSTSTDNQSQSLIKAIIYSAVPWLLGLVIILPITMSGMNWTDTVCGYTSLTLSRARAMYWVSIILPAVLAFGCCLVIMCIRSSPQPTQQMVMVPTAPTTTVTLSAPPPPYPDSNTESDSSKSPQQPPAPTVTGYNQYQYPQQNAGYGYQYPTQFPNQYPQNGPNQNVAHYPSPQPYVYQPAVYSQAPDYLPLSQPVTSDPSKEKNILMWAAILLCFCVIPYAGFNLGYLLDTDRDYSWDELPLIVVSMLFQWLITLRSFITPMLWLGSSTL